MGAAIGSFLNVVVYRLPRRESLIKPRSRCPGCGQPIRARDNIPVVSWVVLRGRCRDCGTQISARYPFIEALTAVVFGAIVLVRGVEWDLAWQIPLAAVLIAIAAIDLEHRLIPNRIVVPAAVWAVLSAAVIRPGDLVELAASGAGAFAFFLLAAVVYPAGMGMGDVKLAGVLGLYLGSAVVPALFVAFLTGSAYGVAVMAREGTGGRKRAVPFGPFLALGGLVGLLAGNELIDLYKDNFL